jgi:hypothetical protein
MVKRLFNIITYPFYLIYLFISAPFKIYRIISDDKIETRRNKGGNSSTYINEEDLVEIGRNLYPDFHNDFEKFITLLLKDQNEFLVEYKALLLKYQNLRLDKLKLIEAVYVFGDHKQLLHITDWRGEENEGEIEEFLENKLRIRSNWKTVSELRNGTPVDIQNDDRLIIALLRAIDQDLKQLNKKLVFIKLDWDSYVFTVIDETPYKTLVQKFGAYFYGTDSLRE